MKLILLQTISQRTTLRTFFLIALCTVRVDVLYSQPSSTGNVYIPSGANVYLNASFTNSPAGGLQFLNNGDFTINGDFTNNEPSMLSGTGNIHFTGTALQNINGTQTFNTYNFEMKNSSNIRLGVNMKVSNLLYPSMGALEINGNTLTLNGNIDGSISNTGTISGSASSDLNIGGSSTNLGTLNFTTGAQTLNTLTLNRTGITNNPAAVLGTGLTVNGFTLTNGILATGNNLLTWTNTGSLSAPNIPFTSNNTSYKNSYICICDGSGNEVSFAEPFDGTKGFRINNAGTDVWFPVGVDFTTPNRMWINNTGTADNFTLAVKKGDLNTTGFPVVQRIWYVKEGTDGGTTASMRLYFTKQNNTLFGISQDEVENGFDYTATRLAQRNYNDNNYLDISQLTDVQNISSNTLGTEVYANYTIGVSPDVANATDGINYFSRFMVLNDDYFILPVTITQLSATQTGSSVQLNWTSLHEENILQYEIERSNDGRIFTTAGKVVALNNGSLKTSYSFYDNNPLSGKNFYRIKIISNDGKISYTNTVNIIINGPAQGISIYPNPVTQKLFILQMNNMPEGIYRINLFTADGKNIFEKMIRHSAGSESQQIQLPAVLSAGVYTIAASGNKSRFTQKLVIQ